jgi:hypothetical protein
VTAPRATVSVALFDEETIVPHGTRRVVWFVRVAEAWVAPSAQPLAVVENRDAGAGTVWERSTIVDLPIGTELMRVETRPMPVRHADPLRYLVKEARHVRRETRRTYFHVDARGQLLPKRTETGAQ